MGILDLLFEKNIWNEFFEYKLSGGHISKRDLESLKNFIDNCDYLPLVKSLSDGNSFCLPYVAEINKKSAKKKRIVFKFPQTENYILKFIAYNLNKYDDIFSENLYSFRRNVCVKDAIRNIIRFQKKRSMYSYKVDISDYFNSVDTTILLPILKETFFNDIPLYNFISSLLTEENAIREGETVSVKKGIMAGVPISGFLANLYLSELDEYFASRHILYARYSDDIIVFAETAEQIAEYEDIIKSFLEKYHLAVNEKKEFRTSPHEPWEFLGFSYCDGQVDVSSVSLQKLKSKMRRQARSLIRWKKRANAVDERAIRAFIRHFNKKFYNNSIHNDVTWCRWYFPAITTDKSLKLIDEYMLESIRYISTGKHTKSNYNLRYETIKSYGYKSLVNAYYKFKKNGIIE